jgi:hypothetical protein
MKTRTKEFLTCPKYQGWVQMNNKVIFKGGVGSYYLVDNHL